jgi:hypothetical protein
LTIDRLNVEFIACPAGTLDFDFHKGRCRDK